MYRICIIFSINIQHIDCYCILKGIMMMLSSAIVDFYLFHDGAVDIQEVSVRRQSRNFSKGGVEEKNFERKMFVDTRINACTHKNYTNIQLFLSSYFSRGLSTIFCFIWLLSFIIERGGGVATPVTPPLDPPMSVESLINTCGLTSQLFYSKQHFSTLEVISQQPRKCVL